MALNLSQKTEIGNLLKEKLENKLQGYERETSYMPFLSKLIQDDEKVASYSFIHSIATMLGMSIYEDVSKIIVEPSSDETETKKEVEGSISPEQAKIIREIIEGLRSGSHTVDKESETKAVLAAPTEGEKQQKEGKIADLYFKRDNIEHYIEIKTVKPNIDVFTATKKKLLEWIARRKREIQTICAFPYNPYHPEPYTRFTEQGVLEKRKELLIAEEYWDFLGGEGTYIDLLEIFDTVGKELKEKIIAKMKEVAEIKYQG